ncbi:MAG TPA: hypothetical protein VJC11_02305 [Patescibacteria group bacterium]|nr:hypothetical protein [Patescibacteria group bacterium]
MHIPSDRIEVGVGSRKFGNVHDANQAYYDEIPQGLLFLQNEMEWQSEILKLQNIPIKGLTGYACYIAYSKDLRLLQMYEREFVQCVKASIRCSISVNGSPSAAGEESNAWKNIEAHIPPVEQGAILRLDSNLAAKNPPELLQGLQEEFRNATLRLMRRFALWLHLLVDKNLIGLVEWTADEVCRYHYFRYQHIETSDAKTTAAHSFDASLPYGERTEVVITKETTTHRQITRERHIHHIVNARMHTVEQYADPMPSRVKEFRDAIPVWLKHQIAIVDGQITMEEVLRRDLANETVTEVEQMAVDKYSPAFTLPISSKIGFSLAGWSADDLDREAAKARNNRVRQFAASVKNLMRAWVFR